jgi:chromosome segregation ATPase
MKNEKILIFLLLGCAAVYAPMGIAGGDFQDESSESIEQNNQEINNQIEENKQQINSLNEEKIKIKSRIKENLLLINNLKRHVEHYREKIMTTNHDIENLSKALPGHHNFASIRATIKTLEAHKDSFEDQEFDDNKHIKLIEKDSENQDRFLIEIEKEVDKLENENRELENKIQKPQEDFNYRGDYTLPEV